MVANDDGQPLSDGSWPNPAADAKSFSDYVRCYVEYVTRPQSDPGHDAEATLRMRLIQLSLSRVDWKVIADSWRRAVAAECEIHCSKL